MTDKLNEMVQYMACNVTYSFVSHPFCVQQKLNLSPHEYHKGTRIIVESFFGKIMNKQAVQVLYVDLLYSYELIVSYGPPKPSFGRSPFSFQA